MRYEYSCFADDFKKTCIEHAKDVMIVYDMGTKSISYSYGEVYDYARRFLAFFVDNGLQRGDTIVSIMPNSPEAIICFFAAMLGEINYAPIPCTVSKREYDNWLNLVSPKMIIKKSGIAEFDSSIKVFECECDGDLSWLSCERSDVNSVLSVRIYLMTSGTTGTPKAMSINSNKLWSSGKAFTQYYKIDNSGYRFWNYLPMSYLGGLFNLALLPLCCKGSFVISEPFSGKTILNYWNFVIRHNITALWFVPSIVQGLLKISRLVKNKHNDEYAKMVKIAFLGTAPIKLEIKEEFEETFGIRLYENFALSESTFLTAEDEDNVRFREAGSVGIELPYASLKFIPIEGVQNISTIWIKSPFMFDGYISTDGTIEIELDKEGYFNSKDLGYLNDDGILVLTGRDRDIIKKGGLFVSLAEIENVVKQMPSIEDAVAVPIKHDFYGEVYILCVIFKQKMEKEEQKRELHLWLLDNFVSYKMPEDICIYDEFPRTSSGKIQKNKLIEDIEGRVTNV